MSKSINICPECNCKMVAVSKIENDTEVLDYFYCKECNKRYYITVE